MSFALLAQDGPTASERPLAPPGGSTQDSPSATSYTPRFGNFSRLVAGVDYSYVGGGAAKFEGAKSGNSDAQAVNVVVAGAIPISEQWFIPVGLGAGNFFLDSVSGVPFPDEIHTLRLHTGLGYRIDEDWTVMATLGPAIYRLDHIDSSDFGLSGMFGATYRMRPNLLLAFGLGINPDSSIPVLPAAGARWDIKTNLTLNLMFPRPALLYRAAPRLSLFAGADVKITVFRADSDQGTRIGQPQFNNALGTYRDFHLGAGAEYELVHGMCFSCEGGYSVGRAIDYKRLNETIDFDPAPYVQAGVRFAF